MIADELKESQNRLTELNKAFDLVDPEFVDTIIYEQMAEESRFNALLRIARKGGINGKDFGN